MERIERSAIDALLKVLQSRGFNVVAPTVRDDAIVYDEISSASQLPAGWTDEQAPATYKLTRRDDNALFGYSVGPYSWKKFLFPPILKLLEAQRTSSGFTMQTTTHNSTEENSVVKKYAFLGVQPCDLQAIAFQDKVFAGSMYTDPFYKSIRRDLMIIAVNCSRAGKTCFCASMETGPKAKTGFDLALTEVVLADDSYFLVEVGSAKGGELLKELPRRVAEPHEIEAVEQIIDRTRKSMGRHLDTLRLPEILSENREHPRWDHVARRCLTCANCTQVCPTCFCSTVEDVTDLAGTHADRVRKWDSCFTTEFSYIHGGSIRATPRSRYRQWMLHKLSSWVEQFGTSGCVGCGRCITWCPVGIDITEEARAIREQQPHSVTSF